MWFNKLISIFNKKISNENFNKKISNENFININNFNFEIMNNLKKPEYNLEFTTNKERWSYALKFSLDKNQTNCYIARAEIEVILGAIEVINNSDLDVSNNKTSKKLAKGKHKLSFELNSDFRNLIFRNFNENGTSKFKINFFTLNKKKVFDISSKLKEYLPLLIKDQKINLNKILKENNINFEDISKFELIKSPFEYQINLNKIFDDFNGKILIDNLKHKTNLIDKFNINMPTKFKQEGYGDSEYFKVFLKQSTIRVYHTLLCLDNFNFKNKKILEVGSFIGYFSSVLKSLEHDVTAFDRYNDFDGALDEICLDMKCKNINVIKSSKDTEDKDFENLEKFDVIICMAVIEHIPHTPKYFLQKLCSKLKKGGILILDTPNLTRLENRDNLSNDISTFQNIRSQFNSDIPWAGHHREFTMDELIYFLKELKFHNIYSKRFDYHIFGKNSVNQNEIHELSKKLIDDTMLDTNLIAGQYNY